MVRGHGLCLQCFTAFPASDSTSRAGRQSGRPAGLFIADRFKEIRRGIPCGRTPLADRVWEFEALRFQLAEHGGPVLVRRGRGLLPQEILRPRSVADELMEVSCHVMQSPHLDSR